MRVLLVNTSERAGGAAIAATRLMGALQRLDIKAKMLVMDKQGDNLSIVGLNRPWLSKWRFLWERLLIFMLQRFRKSYLFDLDPGFTGADITRLKEFKEADLIHLHWVNQGFLSLKDINRILRSGKPVLWTMHDMWLFTGLCHSTITCERYKEGCGQCPLLTSPKNNDLSAKTFRRKQKMLENASNLKFTACSGWLRQTAQQSLQLHNKDIRSIVNPIDSQLYRPRPKDEARQKLNLPKDKTLLLFCSYNVLSPIKGLDYLRQATELLTDKHPELKEQLGIILVGKGGESVKDTFPVKVYPLGLLQDESQMASAYNATDIFVMPSVQDNLPNTIVEAKSSGVPVVGFRLGGVPEMIDHLKDGYIAEPRSAQDLARGINWLLSGVDKAAISALNRENALRKYSENTVAEQYLKLYEEILGNED